MIAARFQGLWSSLAKIPMQVPKQAGSGNPCTSHMQQRQADAVRVCLQPARPLQQLAAAKQGQTYPPVHPAFSDVPIGGHRPVQQSRRQQPMTGQEQQPLAKPCSEQPADGCPQVQFGVFTNLRSGSSFAKQGALSTAAQRKMQEFAADLGQQDDLLHSGLDLDHQQPPAGLEHGKENEFSGINPAELSALQQQAKAPSNSDEEHHPASADKAVMQTQLSFAAEQPGALSVHVQSLTQPSRHDSLSDPKAASSQQEPAPTGQDVLQLREDVTIVDADPHGQVADALTPDHGRTQHVAEQLQDGMSVCACSALQM